MSANPRDIRRLAFQALYQIDARGGAAGSGVSVEAAAAAVAAGGGVEDPAAVLTGMLGDTEEGLGSVPFTHADVKKAFLFASAAYAGRAAADAFMVEAAPGWPAHRQAAVDRAILRLAHHEMTSGATHPKIAVNEAVELAKAYSTEKSPAFINGLLDKLLKQVLAGMADGGCRTADVGTGAEPTGADPAPPPAPPGDDTPPREHAGS